MGHPLVERGCGIFLAAHRAVADSSAAFGFGMTRMREQRRGPDAVLESTGTIRIQIGCVQGQCFVHFPVSRPSNNSKNPAESTSIATFVLGTKCSRRTGGVFVVARVGAEPRMVMLCAA